MEVIGAFRFVDELNPQKARGLYSHLMEAPSVDEYIAPGQRSLRLHCEKIVAVGTTLAGGPPHRSVREALLHTAPILGLRDGQPMVRVRVQ